MAATADFPQRLLVALLAGALVVPACGAADGPVDEPTDGSTVDLGAPGPPGFTPPPIETPPTEAASAEGRPAQAEGPEEPVTWFGPEGAFQVAGGQFEPESLPRAFTCGGPGNTPQVLWRNVPEGTATIAIVLVDESNRTLHWQVTGLDPASDGFEGAEGLPASAVHGPNGVTDDNGYAPPCAEPSAPRTFRWTFLALSEDPGPQGSTDAMAVLDAFREVALAEAEVESVVSG